MSKSNHIQSSAPTLEQSRAIARISDSWQHVRFTRSKTYKGFTLLNLPAQHFEKIATRLFLHGCQSLACGQMLPNRQLWITFSGPQAIIAQLAKLFPCPDDAEPLIVSASGDRILTGWAAAAALKKQVIA